LVLRLNLRPHAAMFVYIVASLAFYFIPYRNLEENIIRFLIPKTLKLRDWPVGTKCW